jgi:hypothetical protein
VCARKLSVTVFVFVGYDETGTWPRTSGPFFALRVGGKL